MSRMILPSLLGVLLLTALGDADAARRYMLSVDCFSGNSGYASWPNPTLLCQMDGTEDSTSAAAAYFFFEGEAYHVLSASTDYFVIGSPTAPMLTEPNLGIKMGIECVAWPTPSVFNITGKAHGYGARYDERTGRTHYMFRHTASDSASATIAPNATACP